MDEFRAKQIDAAIEVWVSETIKDWNQMYDEEERRQGALQSLMVSIERNTIPPTLSQFSGSELMTYWLRGADPDDPLVQMDTLTQTMLGKGLL